MPPMQPGFHANILHDEAGNPIGAITFSDNIRRLAVAAFLQNSDISIGAVELKDGDSDERASIKADAVALTAGGDGGLLLAGRDGSDQYHLRMAGALAAQAYTTRRALVDGVVRGDDGTTYSAVAARAASGAAITGLVGLIGLSQIYGADAGAATIAQISADLGTAISGRSPGGVRALWVSAIQSGVDNTGAAVYRPVEARDTSVDADLASTLIGLLVNARTAIIDDSTGDWRRIQGRVLSAATGTGTASWFGAYTNGAVFGVDNTGAAVVRAVEARAIQDLNGGAATLIGLLTAATTIGRDVTTGNLRTVNAVAAVAAQAYTVGRLCTDAVVRGDDGTTYSAVAARDADANGDFTETLIGLLVNSRNAIQREDSGDWVITVGNLLSGFHGRGMGITGQIVTAFIGGRDTTGAAVVSVPEVRDISADADVLSTLVGILTNSRLSALGSPDYVRLRADSGTGAVAGTETAVHLMVTSLTRGRNTSAGAGSQSTLVEARGMASYAAESTGIIGLLTGGYVLARSGAGATMQPVDADTLAGYDGAALSARSALAVNAMLLGTDTTGASIAQAIEARDAASGPDFLASLIGLVTNSRVSYYEPSTNWRMALGIPMAGDVDGGANPLVAACISEMRESGYASSVKGRRFIATSQTAGAELTAQAAFVATTPTLMLRQSAGATETEIVRSIRIGSGAATPAVIKVVVMLDPDDRFSAGGTTVTPQNPNEGSAAASGITSFLENPTATAADADERIIFNGQFVGGDGASLTLNFKDEAILAGVGTLLIYVFDAAAAAAPTIDYNVEWEEHV